MKKFLLLTLFIAGGAAFASPVVAQNEEDAPKRDRGQFSANLETTNIYYFKDNETGAQVPDGNFGSNSYLKMDYNNSGWNVGLQLEGYAPILQGYCDIDREYKGLKIGLLYAGYTNDYVSVQLGDFFEQYGSGLLLRTYEDRALWFNNALQGARFAFKYKDFFSISVMAGRPRFYTGDNEQDAANWFGGKSKNRSYIAWAPHSNQVVSGANAEISLSSMIPALQENGHTLGIGGSFLYQWEPIQGSLDGISGVENNPNRFGFSARAGYEWNGLSAKFEYVNRGKSNFLDKDGKWKYVGGNAQLFELAYTFESFGASASFRRLDYMASRIDRTQTAIVVQNQLNYLPALTRQYEYMLTNIVPYNVQANGEMGGQIDVFYNFKRGTALGGKRGMKIHGNFSTYFTIDKSQTHNGEDNNVLIRDLSFDVEKQWTSKFKTSILYMWQEANRKDGYYASTAIANTVVLDMTYKITKKHSLRMELQHMWAPVVANDINWTGDWAAGLLEYNFAPYLSVYVSDMWNYGNTDTHYYAVGAAFTHSRLRVALDYGRNRAGYVCSGGVCRNQPAYTGVNLSATFSF